MPARKIVVSMFVALASVLGLVAVGASPPAVAACSISTSLRLGASGEPVRCLQSTLNAQGYSAGPVDGSFGSMTYRAVTRYQQAKGLFVDGVVGRQTGSALGIWGTASAPTGGTGSSGTSGGSTTGGAGCTINTVLRRGSSGAQVRCLQSRLTALGYAVGPIDGAFGTMTANGVVRYQRAKGLFVDGVVGRQTATSLGIWGTTASGGGSTGSTSGGGQCTPPVGIPAGARQVVVVNSSGSRADVDLLVFSGGRWTCARSDMPGRVGRNGVRALASRRSGDGTTPGGTFPLGSMTAPDGQTFQFFGNGVNPGVHGTWRQVRAGDCWGATPNTADYNRLVTRTAATCRTPDEYLVNFQGSYSRAAIIGANLGPNRSGDQPGEAPLAAAIFLHRNSIDAAGNSRPTSGCVSLGNANLIFVLQRLVPGQAYFVIR
jgi:peptidoglycan hydrolase-like protein with peptidoglycan-binding domain/L,D-peptidoglycan transpeptidase YkuD (ErfK/YbiS/YcfS/YnhG family)